MSISEKKESCLINKLNLHFKKLEREVQMKPKPSRRKTIKTEQKSRKQKKNRENQ